MKQSVKRLLTKLNLDEGDVAVRIRFGRCTEAEGGFLAVEALVADAVDAGLTLATEGAGVGIRELQRAFFNLIHEGISVQDAVKRIPAIKQTECEKASKRGGPGYFYILEFLGVPRLQLL